VEQLVARRAHNPTNKFAIMENVRSILFRIW